MLESKDQGHNAQVFSPKKTFWQTDRKFSAKFWAFFGKKNRGLGNFLREDLVLIFRGLFKVFAVFAQKKKGLETKKKKGHDLGPFLTYQKLVLTSAEDTAFLRTFRLRGQGQGLQMCPRGQEHSRGINL